MKTRAIEKEQRFQSNETVLYKIEERSPFLGKVKPPAQTLSAGLLLRLRPKQSAPNSNGKATYPTGAQRLIQKTGEKAAMNPGKDEIVCAMQRFRWLLHKQ